MCTTDLSVRDMLFMDGKATPLPDPQGQAVKTAFLQIALEVEQRFGKSAYKRAVCFRFDATKALGEGIFNSDITKNELGLTPPPSDTKGQDFKFWLGGLAHETVHAVFADHKFRSDPSVMDEGIAEVVRMEEVKKYGLTHTPVDEIGKAYGTAAKAASELLRVFGHGIVTKVRSKEPVVANITADNLTGCGVSKRLADFLTRRFYSLTPGEKW